MLLHGKKGGGGLYLTQCSFVSCAKHSHSTSVHTIHLRDRLEEETYDMLDK